MPRSRSHAYRPQAFTLGGDATEVARIADMLQNSKEVRRQLGIQNLQLHTRTLNEPRIYQWRQDAWQEVPRPRALTLEGPTLPPIQLFQFELTSEARARSMVTQNVPDLVDAIKAWIRAQGFRQVEACHDYTLFTPADATAQSGLAYATPEEEVHGTPEEEVHGTPEEEVHGTPEEEVHGTPEEEVHGTPEEEVHGTPTTVTPHPSPDLVDPTTAHFQLNRQAALQRIGWCRWQAGNPTHRGAGVTVVILDAWPVFDSELDLSPTYVDTFIDFSPPLTEGIPPPPEEQGCNFTIRARTSRYDRTLSQRLMPYHGPLSASLIRTMAPDAHIVAVRTLNNEGRTYTSTLTNAIRWIMTNPHINDAPLLPDPTKVIFNLSLGIGRSQAEIVENCCLFYAIHNACREGVHFVCAAGNDSQGRPENPLEPGAYGYYGDSQETAHRVYPVAGTDRPNRYAFFSNQSIFAAPAVDIIMDPGDTRLRRECGGALVRWRGTSFAAPQMTGLLALLLSHPKPPEDLKQHIWAHATPPRRWSGIPEINVERTLARLTQ